jgi:hypothetical protein
MKMILIKKIIQIKTKKIKKRKKIVTKLKINQIVITKMTQVTQI